MFSWSWVISYTSLRARPNSSSHKSQGISAPSMTVCPLPGLRMILFRLRSIPQNCLDCRVDQECIGETDTTHLSKHLIQSWLTSMKTLLESTVPTRHAVVDTERKEIHTSSNINKQKPIPLCCHSFSLMLIKKIPRTLNSVKVKTNGEIQFEVVRPTNLDIHKATY